MRYKNFGQGTGLKVSELVLGAGLFGTRWGYGAEPEESARMVDAYLDAGGNFIDTADSYQLGQSEELLGGFLEGRRESVVLASKYSLGSLGTPTLTTTGNNRRVMVQSVEASLARLKTDRIDLLWVHMSDGDTSSEEIMRGLDDLVRSGKVVYIGLSNFPAWRVSRAATIAELRGWSQLIGIQIEYSLIERAPDRELVPMAQALGLGVVAWSPLAGGLLTGKYRKGETGRADTFKRLVHAENSQRATDTIDVVLAIARERGFSPAQVSLAWLGAKGVLPILGPRTLKQLQDNLGSAGLDLTAGELARLETASAIAPGYPHEQIAAQRSHFTTGSPHLAEPPARPVA